MLQHRILLYRYFKTTNLLCDHTRFLYFVRHIAAFLSFALFKIFSIAFLVLCSNFSELLDVFFFCFQSINYVLYSRYCSLFTRFALLTRLRVILRIARFQNSLQQNPNFPEIRLYPSLFSRHRHRHDHLWINENCGGWETGFDVTPPLTSRRHFLTRYQQSRTPPFRRHPQIPALLNSPIGSESAKLLAA